MPVREGVRGAEELRDGGEGASVLGQVGKG